MINILSLCDNIVDDKKCWAAEGVSFSISIDNIRILFDTGRSIDVLLHNLSEKSIDIKEFDYIVLSHGHKGHMGAMEFLLPHLNPSTVIVFGKGLDNQKYKVVEGKKNFGSGAKNSEIVKKIKMQQQYMEISATVELTENITLLADVPLLSNHLATFSNKYMVINENTFADIDLFVEEISLCIRCDHFLIIVSGCSHRGIDNIVSYAKSLYPERELYGIFGGFHTKDDETKTELLITYLNEVPLKVIAPCHCTGIYSKSKIKSSFPEIYQDLTTGKSLKI